MIDASIFFFYYLMTGVFKTLSNTQGSSGICPPISLTNIFLLSPFISFFFYIFNLFLISSSSSIIKYFFISLTYRYFRYISSSLFIYSLILILASFLIHFFISILSSFYISIIILISIITNIILYMPTFII